MSTKHLGSLEVTKNLSVSNGITVSGVPVVSNRYTDVEAIAATESYRTTISGHLQDQFYYKNAKHYGALGDGVTDDTLKIQNAIDDPSLDTTIISSGTYLITGVTMSSAGKLILDKGASLKLKDNTAAHNITVAADGVIICGDGTIDGNRANQVSDSNFGLTTNGFNQLIVDGIHITGTTAQGIFIQDSNNSTIQRCRVDNTGNTGIYASASSANLESFVVRDCYIDRSDDPANDGGGIKIHENDPSETQVLYPLVTNCTVLMHSEPTGDYVVGVEYWGDVRFGKINNCTVSGSSIGISVANGSSSCVVANSNVIDPDGIGIELADCTSCMAVGNSVEGSLNPATGLVVDGSGLTASGNALIGNFVRGATSRNLYVYYDADYTTVVGNTTDTTYSGAAGIQILKASNLSLTGNVISGNALGNQAILVNNGSDIVIQGNMIRGWQRGIQLVANGENHDYVDIGGNVVRDTTVNSVLITQQNGGTYGNHVTTGRNPGYSYGNLELVECLRYTELGDDMVFRGVHDQSPESSVTAEAGSFLQIYGVANPASLAFLKSTTSGNTGWLPVQVVDADTTGNRPTGLGAAGTGFCYYDTDLEQPVWWDGSGWLTVSGTVSTHLEDASAHHTRYEKSENDAITGSDGITVVSGSDTIEVQGFRAEFVAASGALSSEIDSDIAAHVAAADPHTNYVLADGSRYFTGANGVGIGAAADYGYSLDVRGSNVKISNEADTYANFRIDSGSTTGQISVFTFSDRGTNKWEFTKTADNDFYVYDSFQGHHVAKFKSYSGNSETLVVASGALGVGAQAEVGYKLDVQGSANIRGTTVSPTGTFANSLTISGSPVIMSSEYQETYLSVKKPTIGAAGDGTTDDASVIQSAIDNFPANGGTLYLPNGTYAVGSSITVTDDNITLIGDGPGVTEIKALGDFPAVVFSGTEVNNVDRGGIRSMTIRGGGKDNASAHGLYAEWVNRPLLTDLVFFSCRHALHLKDVWQISFSDVNIFGQGSDQNHIGLYSPPSENSNGNNAVIANNLQAQSTASHGIRMESFNGSKFVNCEVGGAGGKGWYFGAPSSSVPCQFLHILNCLSDSNTEEAWYFDGKGATSNILKEVQMSNIWAGSCTEGLHVEDSLNFTLENLLFVTFSGHAVNISGSARIDLHGGYVDAYDAYQTGNYNGVLLMDTVKSLVDTINFVSAGSGPAVLESGTSNNNRVLGNEAGDGGGITTIGGGTINANNRT